MEELERTNDRELVERFRTGDREAFTSIYRAHHPAVFRFAFYLTGDRVRAGEVTQDVFVWLIHHPADFDPARGSLPAFLGGVARNLLRRQRQDARRWLPFDAKAAAKLERAAGAGLPAELEGAEDAASLWKAVASLPERYREVVVLCDLEEMPNEEAAVLLGCAIGTVWSRLHRAHGLLLRKLRGNTEKQRCAS